MIDCIWFFIIVFSRSTSGDFSCCKCVRNSVQPWPLETLSPTFPPAPVIVLVRRSNFHNQNPSRPHGKSMDFVTLLSSNFFILMSFAVGTFFIVLDCLSHTYANPHSVFLRTDPAGQLVLDLGLWFLIFFLQHVSQEFTPKICDTVFEIVSVFPMSMASLILFKSKGIILPWPLETLSPAFPPAPVVVLVRRSTSTIKIHQDHIARPWSLSLYQAISSFLCPLLLERSL